jgi:formate dehydrogenase subunit gamma
MADHERQILRYRRSQRLVHALLASSFLLLLVTGTLIVWGPASGLAAGGNSRFVHRVAAVGFMMVPIAYLVGDRRGAKELIVESFRYDRDDWRWLKHIYLYATGHAKDMPPQGRLNAGQKLHHAAVMLLSLSTVISGLALWFFKPSLGASGLAWAAVIHDISMLALTLLLVGHLYFTFTYKALPGMTIGYISETDARLEHAKWVADLEMEEAESVGVTEQSTGTTE